MRIVHLIYSFNVGGAETMLVDIINHQVQKSEIYLVIINNRFDVSLLESIDNSVNIKLIGRREGSKSFLPLLKLNKFIWKINPDAIHCHNHNNINVLLPKFRKKCFCTIHDVGIDNKNFNKYRSLFAISKIVKRDIENRSKAKLELVYNGVKTEKIKPRIELETNTNIFKIVVVSRLKHEKKGQHILIRAISILKERGISNIHLDLIGSGQSESYLKSLCDDLGVQDSVNFLGVKDRSYIYDNLKDYNLLIQPSIFEGFGLTVIEAMAAKIPVLVSNIDGPMELLENGKYGFYFESGNSNALADLIKKIIELTDQNEIGELVESAFEYVSERFQIFETADKYLKLYAEKTYH